MSHTTMLEFTCAEGKGPDFVGMLLGVLGETRAYDGCESVETYADADNPDVVILWEKWSERAKQEAYLQWRIDGGMMEAIGPMLANPPRIVQLTAKD